MLTFVERHLTTGAELEVLLLLHRERDRDWSAAAVGKELRIDTDQAEQMLARLSRSDLLRRERDAYHYGPRRLRTAETVDALAALYPTYRVAIIALIFSRPTGPIRDFSEAFRLRHEDDR